MPARKPLQKATVVETACDTESQGSSNIDKKILDRIQKCLNRAYHANASEAEAKTALFISQKLMSEHNVTQADLLANEGTDKNKAQFGGRSIVKIEKVAGSSPRVQMEAFVDSVASAMCVFFDCKDFSTNYDTKITWTFYGIASNTVAAAMAFEMVHNLILEWSMDYKGGSSTFCYRLGVADGLRKMADREKNAEIQEARQKEIEVVKRQAIEAREAQDSREAQAALEAQQASEVQKPQKVKIEEAEMTDEQESDDDLPAPLTGGYSTDEDFDEYNDNLDNHDGAETKTDFNVNDIPIIDLCSDDDMDETINRFIKKEPGEAPLPSTLPALSPESNQPVKDEPETPKPSTSLWQSEMQLVRFRTTSKQVADDYLTQQNIKLRSGKKRRSNVSDQDSYHQGRKDSAKINVRQKKLCI